jgi:hypothetical protein
LRYEMSASVSLVSGMARDKTLTLGYFTIQIGLLQQEEMCLRFSAPQTHHDTSLHLQTLLLLPGWWSTGRIIKLTVWWSKAVIAVLQMVKTSSTLIVAIFAQAVFHIISNVITDVISAIIPTVIAVWWWRQGSLSLAKVRLNGISRRTKWLSCPAWLGISRGGNAAQGNESCCKNS